MLDNFWYITAAFWAGGLLGLLSGWGIWSQPPTPHTFQIGTLTATRVSDRELFESARHDT